MRKIVTSITVITIALAISAGHAHAQSAQSSPNFRIDLLLLTNGSGSANGAKFQLTALALGGLPVEPINLSSPNFTVNNLVISNLNLPPTISLVETDDNAIADIAKVIKAKIVSPLLPPSVNPISAKIFYMIGGQSFSPADMTPIGTGTDNSFSGSIPASAVTLSGLAYYIKATDAFGQTAFFPPETQTDPKKAIALNVSGDIIGPELETGGVFTKITFPKWRTPDDWSLVSFPFRLPNPDPNAVFAELGTVEEEWQVYRYEGGIDYARAIAIKRPGHPKGDIEKFNSIQRGAAAWIYSAKGGSVSIKGATATNPLTSFPIRVNSGWNQVGNPFRFSRFWNAETIKFSTKVDGSDVIDILAASKANKLTPTLYWRQGKDYVKISADPNVKGSGFTPFPSNFEPWTGYLILAKKDGFLWVDPTVPGPAISLAPTPAAPVYAAGAKGWMLEIDAMQGSRGEGEKGERTKELEQGGRGAGGKDIKTITVGMWEGAKEEEDNFDSPAAPFIASDSESLEFSMPHPEWNNPWAKNYEQDLRAYNDKNSNSAYWEIEVGATHASPLPADDRPSPITPITPITSTPITLTWREIYKVPDKYLLYLVDPAADHFRFRAGEAGEAGEAGGKKYKVINLRQEKSYSLNVDPSGKKLYVVATIDGLGLPEFLAKLLIKKTIAYQNYPNPFNPETWIPYQLSSAGEVSLRIYDVAGRLVRTLNLGRKEVGIYVSKDKAAYWDGRNDYGERVSSGIYFYELRAGKGFRAVKKMVILK